MIYLIDIELSGEISVKAKDTNEALEIANNLCTEEIQDYLFDTKTSILEISSDDISEDERIFTIDDITE